VFKIIGVLFLFIYSSMFSSEIREVKLTQNEKGWIESIKEDEISIYLNSDLEILNYYTKGENKGIYLEVVKILEKSTGLSFQVIKESKETFKEDVDSGIPDIVMGVEDCQKNRNEFYYLEAPIKLNGVFITRDGYPIIDSNTDLTGKSIVYIQGDQIINEIIKKYGNKVYVISKPSPEKAGESLLSGEADIYVEDFEDALKYLGGNQVSRLKINASSPLLMTRYYIGGLNKYQPLVDIIGRIMDTDDSDKKRAHNEDLNHREDKFNLSKEIIDYLEKNEVLKVFVPKDVDAYPIYYKDKLGRQNGFLINYFYEIERILGVKIIFEESTSPEGTHINPCILAINGKNLNSKGYLTTDPYLELQFLIFNEDEGNYMSGLEVLKKYRVAVRKGTLEETYLSINGFDRNLVIFDSDKEVLSSLITGEADATIGEVRRVHYLMRKYHFNNIKVAGIINDKISVKFGIPKENETLYILINSFTKRFSSGIEVRKEKFLEKKIEVAKDFKVSLFITFISVLGFWGMYTHFKKFKVLYSKLTNITLGLVETLESANTYNDEDTGEHVKRISKYSKLIATELKMSKEFIGEVTLYASLHDLGKIGLPDSILKKPGKLTPDEFEQMKKHTEIGFNLMKDLEVSEIALNIIRYHHEKWNGSGYGVGLKEEEIPLEARIVALADVYDAIRQERVYKKAFSHEQAFDIIISESGKHFDPNIVKTFIKKHRKFQKIFDTHS